METERLCLRSFKMGDAQDVLSWLGDPEAMRYIEPVFDKAKAEEFIRTCGHLVYCLCLRESGQAIGHVIWHPYMEQHTATPMQTALPSGKLNCDFTRGAAGFLRLFLRLWWLCAKLEDEILWDIICKGELFYGSL